MTGRERYRWADEPIAATVTVVGHAARTAEELLAVLSPVAAHGELTFDAALDVQGGLYDDGTFDERAVMQAQRLAGDGGDWWVVVEPNGYRLGFSDHLADVARGARAAAFFWNANAVMRLTHLEAGEVLAELDPLDVDDVPEEGRDLPFEEETSAATFALLERWTGVAVTGAWFAGAKPTYVVEVPESPRRSAEA